MVDSTFGARARLLVERAKSGRGCGLAVIGVRSNIIRERTHVFYERLGYAVTKTQKVFRKKVSFSAF